MARVPRVSLSSSSSSMACLAVLLSRPAAVAAGEPAVFRLHELQTRYLSAKAEGCELALSATLRSESPTIELKLDQERCPLPFSARRAGLDRLWQRLVGKRDPGALRVASVLAPIYPEAADRLARAALVSREWLRYVRQARRDTASAALVLELLRQSNAYRELRELLVSWGQDCELSRVEKIAELRGPARGPSASRQHAAAQWLPALPRGMRVPLPLLVWLQCKPPAPAAKP